MSLDYDVMVWNPFDVGMRDDSFPDSQWSATSATKTHIDGDYVKVEVAGLSEAIIPAFETSVVVQHGCSSPPLPIANPKIDIGGRRCWVDTVGGTYFTIHVDSMMTVDIPFWWTSPITGCTGGAGGTGYIEKTGISVDPSTYPYICLALWGNAGYFIEVYENAAWNTIVSSTPSPKEYDFAVHYIGDLGLGTITGIRLGVTEVPSAWVTYDFVEFHKKVPQYPSDLINAQVNQRRDASDYFQLNVIQNGYVGSDVVLLMNFEEDVGEKVYDESTQGHIGTFNEHGILVLYDDDETIFSTAKWGAGSYNINLIEETTIVKSGQSSAKGQSIAGSNDILSLRRSYGSGQDWSSYDFISLYFYGRNSGAKINLHIADTGAGDGWWNITENWSGWKRLTLPLNSPKSGTPDLTIVSYFEIYWTGDGFDRYLDRIWLVQGPAFTETDHGFGLQFDGEDDAVETDSMSMSGSRTMMAWITPDFDYDDGLLHSIVDWRHATSRKIFLAKHSDSKMRFLHDSTDDGGVYLSNSQTIIFSAGERHHIAGVFDIDTKTVNLYWDGILLQSLANAGAVSLTNTSPVRIGHGTWGFHKGIIDEVLISNRAISATEIKRTYDAGPPSRVYVKGRYIRIVLDNGTNRGKVFSGVIQNAIPSSGILFVDGQCLQMKINRGTINEEYMAEDLDVAVQDLAANYPEVTTSRVASPVPNIPYTKTYDEVYGANALDEMASVPSKQTPYDMWIWELGYGQDLAFRAYNDPDVRVCTVAIDQDINVLRGVQRAEDIYDLSNKVVVIGGLMKHPEDDVWCDAITDWTTDDIISFTAQTWNRTTGTHGLRIYADDDVTHWIHRDIPEFDASKYKRIVFDVWWDGYQENAPTTMGIQVHSAVSGHHTYRLISSSQKGLTTGEWVRHSIDLDDPMWGTSGSPEWDDIDGIRFFCVNGSMIKFTYYIDNIHFETDNEKATATASIDRAFEDRTYVYKDAKITKLADLDVFSEGLVRALQEVSDRFMIPVIGDPEFQRGRRVPVDLPYFDLDGNYYIAEVDHLFGRGFGYTCQIILSTGRMDFSLEIAKSLSKDLRRESAGGITL